MIIAATTHTTHARTVVVVETAKSLYALRGDALGVFHRSSAVTLRSRVKDQGRTLVIAPQVGTAAAEALRYMARTNQRRTYLSSVPAVAGTHLPTPRGWRVD